jgi:von Willebrand factor type A domain
LSLAAGNAAKVDFSLSQYSNKSQVLAAINNIVYLGENTNMTGGLRVARLQVFDTPDGRRQGLDGMSPERILVLITDGVPTYDADKLDDEVVAVKADNVRIIAVGVTDEVSLGCHAQEHCLKKFELASYACIALLLRNSRNNRSQCVEILQFVATAQPNDTLFGLKRLH